MIEQFLLLFKAFLFICVLICLIPAGTTGLFFYVCYVRYRLRRYLACLCTLWAVFATFAYFALCLKSTSLALFFSVFALVCTPFLVKFRLWWICKMQSNAHVLIELVYFPFAATFIGMAFVALLWKASPQGDFNISPSMNISQQTPCSNIHTTNPGIHL